MFSSNVSLGLKGRVANNSNYCDAKGNVELMVDANRKREGMAEDLLPYAELGSRQMSNDWVSTSCALCT